MNENLKAQRLRMIIDKVNRMKHENYFVATVVDVNCHNKIVTVIGYQREPIEVHFDKFIRLYVDQTVTIKEYDGVYSLNAI